MKLHARAATLDDAGAIDDLLDSYALTYQGRSSPRGAAHFRLAEEGSVPGLVEDTTGTVVGFGHAWRAGPVVECYARVHPDATGRGVGTALLSYLEQRARTFGVDVFHVMQPGTDTAGPGLLRARGYTEIRYLLQMRVGLSGYEPPATPVPDGVDVVGFDSDRDSAQLFAACQAAFPDDPTGEDQWWNERRANPDSEFDPALWFVARQGGEIVGTCLGERRDWMGSRDGYICDVGVHPRLRGQGIAFALLVKTLTAFEADGLPTGTLSVDTDNPTGALRLYRKAGMHSSPLSTEWSKTLTN